MKFLKNIKANHLRYIVVGCIAAVILVTGIFRTAVSGAGTLSSFGYDLISTICPLGALETMIAAHTIIPRVLLSLGVVILIIVITGRAFCAWVCPVPVVQKIFPGFSRKKENALEDRRLQAIDMDNQVQLRKEKEAGTGELAQAQLKAEEQTQKLAKGHAEVISAASGQGSSRGLGYRFMRAIGFDSRYVILAATLISTAAFGVPVFCLVCPVGLIFATIFTVARLFMFGELTVTLLAFPIILILELVVFRKWCTKICPLGALVSLIASANVFFRLSWNKDKCVERTSGVACALCHKACSHENVDPRGKREETKSLHACTKCRDCAQACPTQAISFPFIAKLKKEPIPSEEVPDK